MSEWANFPVDPLVSGWSARGGQTSNPYVLDRNPWAPAADPRWPSPPTWPRGIGTETFGSVDVPGSVNATSPSSRPSAW